MLDEEVGTRNGNHLGCSTDYCLSNSQAELLSTHSLGSIAIHSAFLQGPHNLVEKHRNISKIC